MSSRPSTIRAQDDARWPAGDATERRSALVSRLCRLLERSDPAPTLAALATSAGFGASHTHRMFKAATGVTPKAYALAHRAARVRAALRAGHAVTEAIYSAGYNSSGRFYEKSTTLLGMTPREYQSGATSWPIHFAIGDCSLGSILVAATVRGVCAILLGDDPEELAHELERRFPRADVGGCGPGV